jgi:hypothetical protein
VFVTEIESFTPNNLPDGCREFYRIELFSVSEGYRGFVLFRECLETSFLLILRHSDFLILIFRVGLGKILWQESLKLARKHGFQFVESLCSAKASAAIGMGVRVFRISKSSNL